MSVVGLVLSSQQQSLTASNTIIQLPLLPSDIRYLSHQAQQSTTMAAKITSLIALAAVATAAPNGGGDWKNQGGNGWGDQCVASTVTIPAPPPVTVTLPPVTVTSQAWVRIP
jgi:hypothetical protein